MLAFILSMFTAVFVFFSPTGLAPEAGADPPPEDMVPHGGLLDCMQCPTYCLAKGFQ